MGRSPKDGAIMTIELLDLPMTVEEYLEKAVALEYECFPHCKPMPGQCCQFNTIIPIRGRKTGQKTSNDNSAHMKRKTGLSFFSGGERESANRSATRASPIHENVTCRAKQIFVAF